MQRTSTPSQTASTPCRWRNIPCRRHARHAGGETSRAGGGRAMHKRHARHAENMVRHADGETSRAGGVRVMRRTSTPSQTASTPCRWRNIPCRRRARHATYTPCGKHGAPCGRRSTPRRRHARHAENMVRHAGGAAFRTPRTHNKARRIPEKRTRPSQHLSRQRIPLASAADHLPPHADASLVACASPHRTLFSSPHTHFSSPHADASLAARPLFLTARASPHRSALSASARRSCAAT